MAQQTSWWWVRHAPVTSTGGRIYGNTDPPADTDDPDTYGALARYLPSDAVLLTSHLQRTTQTAAAISGAGLALPKALVEPDLGEQNFGDWHGKTREEIFDSTDPAHPFWLASAEVRAPGGESFTDVAARVRRAVERLTAQFAGRNIVAVAHGGTIRAALCHALDLTPDGALAFEVDNCSVTRVTYVPPNPHHPEGSWAVTHVNQRAAGY